METFNIFNGKKHGRYAARSDLKKAEMQLHYNYAPFNLSHMIESSWPNTRLVTYVIIPLSSDMVPCDYMSVLRAKNTTERNSVHGLDHRADCQ